MSIRPAFALPGEAYARLEELGLIDIAESAPAYIICPNPLNGESYTQDDLNVYYESQIYLAGGKIISFTPPAGEYERRTYNNLQYIVAEGQRRYLCPQRPVPERQPDCLHSHLWRRDG